MAKQAANALTALKQYESRQPAVWVARCDAGSFSYMDVTYKCGCTVRGNEADRACSKHLKGIKRIVRVTEYL